jgi:hypothetical protein
MNNIPAEQNDASNIKCLVAQRVLYSKAKHLVALQLILSVPVMILVVSATALYKKYNNIAAPCDISWIAPAYAVILTIVDLLFLVPCIVTLKTKAAKVQELFDCHVLGISWKRIVANAEPEPEEINALSVKYLKINDPVSLRDWYYSGPIKALEHVARIICQRSNVRWDCRLRSKYSWGIFSIAVIMLIMLLVIGLVNGWSIRFFVSGILAPMLPLFLFWIRQHQENKTAIEKLNIIKEELDHLWAKALRKDNICDDWEALSRNIQDGIFLNRKSNPLIFDWFYKIFRSQYEEDMNYSVTQQIAEYDKSR